MVLEKTYLNYGMVPIFAPAASLFFRTPDETDESRSHCVLTTVTSFSQAIYERATMKLKTAFMVSLDLRFP